MFSLKIISVKPNLEWKIGEVIFSKKFTSISEAMDHAEEDYGEEIEWKIDKSNIVARSIDTGVLLYEIVNEINEKALEDTFKRLESKFINSNEELTKTVVIHREDWRIIKPVIEKELENLKE